jgi:hypothetical protein
MKKPKIEPFYKHLGARIRKERLKEERSLFARAEHQHRYAYNMSKNFLDQRMRDATVRIQQLEAAIAELEAEDPTP